jgi:hypothetical protein
MDQPPPGEPTGAQDCGWGAAAGCGLFYLPRTDRHAGLDRVSAARRAPRTTWQGSPQGAGGPGRRVAGGRGSTSGPGRLHLTRLARSSRNSPGVGPESRDPRARSLSSARKGSRSFAPLELSSAFKPLAPGAKAPRLARRCDRGAHRGPRCGPHVGAGFAPRTRGRRSGRGVSTTRAAVARSSGPVRGHAARPRRLDVFAHGWRLRRASPRPRGVSAGSETAASIRSRCCRRSARGGVRGQGVGQRSVSVSLIAFAPVIGPGTSERGPRGAPRWVPRLGRPAERSAPPREGAVERGSAARRRTAARGAAVRLFQGGGERISGGVRRRLARPGVGGVEVLRGRQAAPPRCVTVPRHRSVAQAIVGGAVPRHIDPTTSTRRGGGACSLRGVGMRQQGEARHEGRSLR